MWTEGQSSGRSTRPIYKFQIDLPSYGKGNSIYQTPEHSIIDDGRHNYGIQTPEFFAMNASIHDTPQKTNIGPSLLPHKGDDSDNISTGANLNTLQTNGWFKSQSKQANVVQADSMFGHIFTKPAFEESEAQISDDEENSLVSKVNMMKGNSSKSKLSGASGQMSRLNESSIKKQSLGMKTVLNSGGTIVKPTPIAPQHPIQRNSQSNKNYLPPRPNFPETDVNSFPHSIEQDSRAIYTARAARAPQASPLRSNESYPTTSLLVSQAISSRQNGDRVQAGQGFFKTLFGA